MKTMKWNLYDALFISQMCQEEKLTRAAIKVKCKQDIFAIYPRYFRQELGQTYNSLYLLFLTIY